MKTLSLSIILFVIIIFLGFGIGSAHADNTNDVYIQDIQVQPSSVKVGETFTVSATLTNNSTFPIYMDGGKCSVQDTQAELFTITPDSHAKNKLENIFCAGVGWSQLLDSGKSITLSNPDYTDTYVATEPGIATITVKFSYHSIIQKDPIQTSDEQTISKSFQFQVHDINSDSSGPPIPMPGTLLPLQQFRSGIAAKDITCKEEFQLIIKAEDGSPACVKPDTAQKLIERGWGTLHGIQTFFPSGNIENDTTQPLIPPSQLPHIPLGNLPVNKTALAFSKIPNWDKKFVCEKYPDSSIQITAEISNALKFSGTVTDPKGVIHDILPIALNNTQMQIQFLASTSDPDGNYVTSFKVVNGSNTSNVNFYCVGSMMENGTLYPALHVLPP